MWKAFQYRRLLLFLSLTTLGFAALAIRLIEIQVIHGPELRVKARDLFLRTGKIPPWRGQIKARDGHTLAMSTPVRDVYCDLVLGSDYMRRIMELSTNILGENDRQLKRRWLYACLRGLQSGAREPQGAVLLKRQASWAQWDQLTNVISQEWFGFDASRLTRSQAKSLRRLRQHLVTAQDDQARFYPYTNLAGVVIGHVKTGPNDQGVQGASGIELTCESFLAGKTGLSLSERDAAGQEQRIRRAMLLPAEDGWNVVLTIDLGLQMAVERELLVLVTKYHPNTASILVTRPQTGEILAWACWPPFNSSIPPSRESQAWRNDPLAAMREPGSVFKPFVLAAALNEELVSLDHRVYCSQGLLLYKGARISDHGLAYGWVPVRLGFAKSLNTMHAWLATQLGGPKLFGYVTNFGFGQLTGIPLPGEMPGWIGARTNKSESSLLYVGFGQGISVTSLQLVMAMGAIANNGLLMRPMLLARIEDSQGHLAQEFPPEPLRQVISPQTADQVMVALQAAVAPEGTGSAAALSSHTCGGKTGTAQQSERGKGYATDRVCAYFCGLCPAQNPAMVICVTVDDPKGQPRTGGAVAAPVFRRVAEQAVAIMNIPADKPNPQLSSIP
jgi:cell division protein FtsI (penicillin-binding protein 3)